MLLFRIDLIAPGCFSSGSSKLNESMRGSSGGNPGRILPWILRGLDPVILKNHPWRL